MVKKKATEKTNGAVDDPGRGHVGEAQPPPTLSVSELKTLFRSYDQANAQVEKARKELEGALAARSAIVEQIAAGAGKRAFSYKGQVLTVSCRTNKTTGESTWFFKGPSKSDLVEVS
jgi:hypothetical protein